MRSTVESGDERSDISWFVIRRRLEYDGEGRANLLRIIAIAAFYGIELINFHGLKLGFLELPRQEGVDRTFHTAVTTLAVAWVALGLGVQFCLRRRIFPASLKYVATGADIVFLTSVLVIADGPRSPLVVGYFLLVPLAALRFSLPFVRFATAGTMLGYLFLCGWARWFSERDLRVPRYHQLMVLLAVLLSGIILGQVVRRVRAAALNHPLDGKKRPPSADEGGAAEARA